MSHIIGLNFGIEQLPSFSSKTRRVKAVERGALREFFSSIYPL